MFALSGAAAGAGDELEALLKQKFLEITERQRQKQAADALGVQAELGRGNLDMRRKEFEASQQPAPKAPPRRMQVGGRVIDPDTGQVVYEPPASAPAPQRPFVVNGHLVDASGKVIFKAPEKPTAPKSDAGPKDDPTLPRGVQDYVVQLRSKYDAFEDAAAELARAMPDVRKAHPSLDSVKAINALRSQYGGSANPRPAKTPEEIAAEVRAREGAKAEAKQNAGGGGLLDAAVGVFRGKKAEGPKVGERRTINGTLAQWDGQGWVAVER